MRGSLVTIGCALLFACAPKPQEPVKAPPAAVKKPALVVAAPPVEPPRATLRTGELAPRAPVDRAVTVLARSAGRDFETLKVDLGVTIDESSQAPVASVRGATLAFVSPSDRRTLWVRRPVALAADPIHGSLFVAAERSEPGQELRLRQGGPLPKAQPASLDPGLFSALSQWFHWTGAYADPFAAFASHRLRDLAAPEKKAKRATGSPLAKPLGPYAEHELSELMNLTTGRTAVQRALMADRSLSANARRAKRTVPLSSVRPPTLPRADYKAMLAALGREAPDEPLARAAPADFWYFRSRTFPAFLDALDLVDEFGQPAANVLDGHATERGTSLRYLAELGIERTELARVLGPSAIESVALVGSDPYVHAGTDVTVLFKVKVPALFEAALAKALAVHAGAHGGVTTASSDHAGVAIRSARSPDGRVRQERAQVAGLELVSNSPSAIRRVIDAALGKAPRLSDEPDLAFLLARDRDAPDESFGFLSDRFVLATIGPQRKIAAARRELALGELTVPGVASLLHGWLNGKPATSEKELIVSGALVADEGVHFDRSPIVWQPGKPARSRYGTVSALEPLIDLPRVDKVTPDEQQAYEQFADQYSALWTEYVDPVALRLARAPGERRRYQGTLRALPVLMRENSNLIRIVGSARVDAPEAVGGLRYTLGIGEDADIRRELTKSSSLLGRSFAFDWLGDHVVLGIADRSELTHVARELVREKLEPPDGSDPERRRGSSFEAALRLPAYLVVGVRNRVGAALVLGGLRALAKEAAPDMFRWQEEGKHRGIGVVRIEISPTAGGLNVLDESASLYYALCPQALVLSLSRPVLGTLIDAELDGKAPRAVTGSAPAHGQLLVELGADKQSAFSQVLGWLFTMALVGHAPAGHASAEAVLRGAPEARLNDEAFRTAARATLGYVPLTPDGAVYRLTEQGLADPARGTSFYPIFPAAPAPGSPLASLLDRFEGMSTAVSFDREPAAGSAAGRDSRSFVAKMTLDLAPR